MTSSRAKPMLRRECVVDIDEPAIDQEPDNIHGIDIHLEGRPVAQSASFLSASRITASFCSATLEPLKYPAHPLGSFNLNQCCGTFYSEEALRSAFLREFEVPDPLPLRRTRSRKVCLSDGSAHFLFAGFAGQ